MIKKMLTDTGMKVLPLSGFPEFLPKEQLAFNRVMDRLRHLFESYNFLPLDNRVVERISTLLSKGNDHEIYGLYRLAEEGDKKDLGLRFDLTIPLARYVAQNYGQLTFPYRRYQMAPVWRGERPQAGRYRQFYQCDIDIIAEGELSSLYDAELLTIIQQVMQTLELTQVTIRVNNRKILYGLMRAWGFSEAESPERLRLIDKVHKMDRDQWKDQLQKAGFSPAAQDTLERFLTPLPAEEGITFLRSLGTTPLFQEGVTELETLFRESRLFGADLSTVVIDPSLARGLDYYTGTVYEVVWDEAPELGTICAGGRYGNLVGGFTNKTLPGVGISVGLSRLVPKMIERGILNVDCETIASVLVTTQDPTQIAHYLRLGQALRQASIPTEVYLSARPLAAQMRYADKRGFRVVILAAAEEMGRGELLIRDLRTGHQHCIPTEQLVPTVAQLIALSDGQEAAP